MVKLSKKQQRAEELKRSDIVANLVGRDDIEYGEHTELPTGENVALIGRNSDESESDAIEAMLDRIQPDYPSLSREELRDLFHSTYDRLATTECWCGLDKNDGLPRLDIICPKHDGVVTDDAPNAPQEIQEHFNRDASQGISFVPALATPSEKKK